MFEERLKTLQGEIESQTLKNAEINELYSELADSNQNAENKMERLTLEREELIKKLDNLQGTVNTLNQGHSVELADLRQQLEESQAAYSSLDEKYLQLQEEFSEISEELDAKREAEGSHENSEEVLEILKSELEKAKSECTKFEQTVNSLKEEKQESEKKGSILKEKLDRKKAEIAGLKDAVKKYVAEFDKLQQELSEEKQIRSEIEEKLESHKNSRTNGSEEIELLRRLLDEESAKCLRIAAELKHLEERCRDYDMLKESLETEKLKSERLEVTIGALTDNEETVVLRKALGEAQTKVENLEHTVELLKENNKVIDELRKELEEERSTPKSSRSSYTSSAQYGKNEEVDDLRRELLIEKAKRSEIEQSYHSLQGSMEVRELR